MLHIDPFAIRELLGADAAPGRRAITGEHGVVLPAFTDHHVHLHLIDEHDLAPHGIAAVVDLGGDPIALARRPHEGFPRVAYAGAFLTAPGGYPVGRLVGAAGHHARSVGRLAAPRRDGERGDRGR